jgi:hypothetical protein
MAVTYGPQFPKPTVFLDALNVASYPGSGSTWSDISGNGNHFTLFGSPTYSSGTILLNGSTQYIKRIVGTSTAFDYGTGDFTFEFWTKPVVTSGTGGLWYQSGSNEVYYTSSGLSSFLSAATGVGSNLYTTGWGTLTIGNWYHLACTRISGTTYLYRNGTLMSSGADTENYTHSDADYIIFGALYGTPSNFYNGYYSVVRVFNGKALTATQINGSFNSFRGRYGV